MLGLIATAVVAMFIHDNAEFIQDMNDKREWGCTFSYSGKQYARDDVPHIAIDDTYIYFTMEPCDD